MYFAYRNIIVAAENQSIEFSTIVAILVLMLSESWYFNLLHIKVTHNPSLGPR